MVEVCGGGGKGVGGRGEGVSESPESLGERERDVSTQTERDVPVQARDTVI